MAMFAHVARGKPRPTPHVNVTPLVDVALVVLIIFMVVTPMMTKTFWLNLPRKHDRDEQQDAAPSEGVEAPLVMTVDKAGTIRVNKVVLAPNEIPTRLPRMLAAQRHKVLYFDAHDEVTYGRAVQALDLSRAGGAKSIAILTESVMR